MTRSSGRDGIPEEISDLTQGNSGFTTEEDEVEGPAAMDTHLRLMQTK